MSRDITVLIATFNRADELRRTLDRMIAAVPAGRDVEIVVVDNNSTDDTRSVIDRASEKGSVRYLFEPRPGKNCALNTALRSVDLGRIAVFTDDDIDVAPDYFTHVERCCEERPESFVFGGRMHTIWPGEVPAWVTDPSILGWGFPVLDLGDEPRPFPDQRFPAGGNLWVRREVFEDGARYNETMGPRPTNRLMGSEVSFMQGLLARGHHPYYYPAASVGHRVRRDEITPRAIRRRAFRAGRTSPHLWGLGDRGLLARSRLLWRAKRYASLARYGLLMGLHSLLPGENRRTLSTVADIRGLGYNLEALRLEKIAHESSG